MPAQPTSAKSQPQKALVKLGLLRDIDLALHLPLRYEDRTRLTPIRDLRIGDSAQVEGTIEAVERSFRRNHLLAGSAGFLFHGMHQALHPRALLGR